MVNKRDNEWTSPEQAATRKSALRSLARLIADRLQRQQASRRSPNNAADKEFNLPAENG